MKSRALTTAWLGLLALTTTTAFGHDYWLAPASSTTTRGAKVDVRLYRGEPLDTTDERPLEIEKTARFRLLAQDQDQDLLKSGTEGQTPVARVALETDGGNLVTMERHPQPNQLDSKKFTEYLKEEGLDAIIAQRKALGESEADGRERYSRYLKALIQVGDKRDETYRRVVGHLLEIILEVDPASPSLGHTLPVRILFEGRPLPEVQVSAHVRDDGKVHGQTLTTDAEGRATVRLDHKGSWLIRLVHMRRAPAGSDADWESFWAAYTFGL